MQLKMVVEDGIEVPAYAHDGDAGLDLRVKRDVYIRPGETVKVGTGVSMAIPDGYVGHVYMRSGFSTRSGIVLANGTGIIDGICRPAGVPIIAGEAGICGGCGVATLSIDYYDIGYAAGEMAYEILVNGANPGDMEIQYAPEVQKLYNEANSTWNTAKNKESAEVEVCAEKEE